MLRKVSGLTADFVDGSNHCQNLINYVQTNFIAQTANIADNAITGAKIANGTITGSDIAGSTITNANLAAGVAVANLGYTPVNKAGDGMTNAQLAISRDIGIGAGTWNAAPLLIQTVTAGGNRPSIGFSLTGVGAVGLYLDLSPTCFRFVDNGGTSYTLCDSLNDFNYNNFGKTFWISNSSVLKLDSNIGLAAGSWSGAKLLIQSVNTNTRPGIGFNASGFGTAAFLYYDSDNKFKFVDNTGAVHAITSS